MPGLGIRFKNDDTHVNILFTYYEIWVQLKNSFWDWMYYMNTFFIPPPAGARRNRVKKRIRLRSDP